MHLAGVPLRQSQVSLILLHIEEAGQDLDGVGAFLLDVITGVPAFQSFETTLKEEVILGCILALEAEGGLRRHTTGTGDEDLAFLF